MKRNMKLSFFLYWINWTLWFNDTFWNPFVVSEIQMTLRNDIFWNKIDYSEIQMMVSEIQFTILKYNCRILKIIWLFWNNSRKGMGELNLVITKLSEAISRLYRFFSHYSIDTLYQTFTSFYQFKFRLMLGKKDRKTFVMLSVRPS